MSSLNAYTLQALKELNIDVGHLGCVMLDLETSPISLPPEWLYTSQKPELSHVKGVPDQKHTTLLYGLLPGVSTNHVSEVLAGWAVTTPEVAVTRLRTFASPMPDEPYTCIVAELGDPRGELLDAHQRLSMLPHVDTHLEYIPHMTIAYVHNDWVELARRKIPGSMTVTAATLNISTVSSEV